MENIYCNEADDKFLSKMAQVGYAGERVAKLAKAVQEITQAIKFQASGKDYFAANNDFAQ